MLARHQRLSRKRIEYLFKKGRKFVQPWWIIRYIKTSEAANRYCIIVSTKIAAKAVARNVIRRRISEAIRLQQKNLKKTTDLILITTSKVVNQPYQKLETAIIKLFDDLNRTN